MGLFSKKDAKQSKEDTKIRRLIEDIAAEVAIYTGKCVKIEQELNSLRGLVNRKLGNSSGGSESYKNEDAFDSLRHLNKQFPNKV